MKVKQTKARDEVAVQKIVFLLTALYTDAEFLWHIALMSKSLLR